MIALIPVIAPLLVQIANGIFHGSGKGAEKKSWVMNVLGIVWDKLEASGKLPENLKGDKEVFLQAIDAIVDAIVAATKK